MEGRYYNENAPRRRRRRKKPNYMPAILLALAVLICTGAIVAAVLLITGSQRDTLSGPTGDLTHSPEPSTTPAPDVPTDPSTGEAIEPTDPAEAQALIAKADFIAAGYNYESAIAMLQEYPDFEEFPEMADKVATYQQLQSQLIRYPTPEKTTHIFFHSLIVDTGKAFDGDGDSGGYNMYMTTVDEFVAILEQMYERGFVLISPYDLAYEYTDETGTHFKYGDIYLPEGKHPFIMSQDDVNYYSYMIGTGSGKGETPIFVDGNCDGFAHKIVIGEDGFPTCEYMDENGNIVTGDYDLVPILEKFIQAHPDFSYRGARAILGVTGYEGVFGYRTKPSYETALGSEAYAAEVQAAKEVAQCLKDHGWIIASHSYGHPAYGEITNERVISDSDKWENTVQPIVGETDVILYPHGSDIHTWHKYPNDNVKFKALYEDGYRYFFNVDSSQYWNQLGDTYFRGGRRNLDGIRMYYNPELLADLFDAAEVFDKKRPTPVPKSGWGM